MNSDLIDVVNHNTSIKSTKMANDYPHLLRKHFQTHTDLDSETEEDEEAWLRNIEEADKQMWSEVKGLAPGTLVLTLNEPSISAAKRSLKS